MAFRVRPSPSILRNLFPPSHSSVQHHHLRRPNLSEFTYKLYRKQSRNMTSIGTEDMSGLNGPTGMKPASEQHEINAWSGPGVAAFDFRSDVVTTPTSSMLEAIRNTTLLDDVFVEDPTTNALEAQLATMTKHEAGLFVLSGTMGNQIALRSHLTQPPYSVLCDDRAHILRWEAGGTASLCGALVEGVIPRNNVYLTLEDIKKHVVISDDVHSCPTRVIALENTLAGTVMPLQEVKRISEFARANDIRLHLDGARIWEAVASGAGTLPEYTSLFDSASLCFSKGLGAPVGSMLVGTKAFIKHARWVRKSIGGGLRQPGVVTAAAKVAVDETFGREADGSDGKLRASHVTAKRIAGVWEGLGGRLDQPTETNMVWIDLEDAGCSGEEFARMGKEVGLRLGASGRLVVHYQIGDEAVGKLEEVFRAIMDAKKNGAAAGEAKVGERKYGQ